MTSLITPSNIDITYPIAGQDNDTQGFRNNFQNIRDNFIIAAGEITSLQSNVAVLQTLTGGTFGNISVRGNVSQSYQLANLSASSNVTVSSTSSVTILDSAAGVTISQANVFLPVDSSLNDGQTLTIASNIAITTITVYPAAGNYISGAPTSYTANTATKWLYSETTERWYRI
jgi:hypothetical protein